MRNRRSIGQGFSQVEIILLLVVIGTISFVGWYVFNRQSSSKKIENTSVANNKSKQETPKVDDEKTSTYSFKELGISMDILPGWEIISNHTQEQSGNRYNWTVQKSDADGKIELSSTGFEGGFYSCDGKDSLTSATVLDVAPTKNSDLTFMSWTFNYNNEHNFDPSNKIYYGIKIVRSDGTNFSSINDSTAIILKNKDVKPGKYFFCLTEPLPGFSLSLNKETLIDASRIDKITALSKDSSDSMFAPLMPTAQSYADIKTMLLTIKSV